MSRLHYRPQLKAVARRLRSDQTPAEHKLWMHLRRQQVLDVQFLRQRPIGEYVVDFFAPTAKLVIEVDGGQHYADEQEQRDKVRDEFLERQGCRVLRFTNSQVLTAINDVLGAVHQALLEALNPPQPPFFKGGSMSAGDPT